jgi:drug/metabolite transporter (DMT)-like permease
MASPPETAPIPGTGRKSSGIRSATRESGSGSRLAVWAALTIVYIVWGSTYLGIRISVETLPPMLSAGFRFGTAGLVLGGILLLRGRRLRVSMRQLGGAALVGVLLLAGGNGGVVYAEAGGIGRPVPSGVAALLIALVPLLVVILRTSSGDRPRVTTVLGVIIGLAGLVVLVAVGGGAKDGTGGVPIVGALIVVAASVSWATGSFLSQKVTMPADPFVAAVYEMLVGGLALVTLGVARGESWQLGEVSGRSWLALVYLTVAGSLIAFTAYVWLLQHAPISLTATYAYVNPAVAVLLGALVVSEPVTAPIVLGGLIIIVGVALVVSTERPGKRAASERAAASDPDG